MLRAGLRAPQVLGGLLKSKLDSSKVAKWRRETYSMHDDRNPPKSDRSDRRRERQAGREEISREAAGPEETHCKDCGSRTFPGPGSARCAECWWDRCGY